MNKETIKGLGVLVVLAIFIAPAMHNYLKQDSFYTSQRQISETQNIQQAERNRISLCDAIVKAQKSYGLSPEEIKVNDSYVEHKCNSL